MILQGSSKGCQYDRLLNIHRGYMKPVLDKNGIEIYKHDKIVVDGYKGIWIVDCVFNMRDPDYDVVLFYNDDNPWVETCRNPKKCKVVSDDRDLLKSAPI